MTRSEAGTLGAIKTKMLWRKRYEENPKHCKECGNQLKYESRHNQFCDHSCAASYNNRGKVRNYSNGKQSKKPCLQCGDVTTNEKFCGHKCFSKWQYDNFIEQWLVGKTDAVICNGMAISNYVKTWLRENRGDKCEWCGWNEKNPSTNKCPVQVHHKDGNAQNNVPGNLCLLCPNCHSLTPTFGGLNRGNGRKCRYISKGGSIPFMGF